MSAFLRVFSDLLRKAGQAIAPPTPSVPLATPKPANLPTESDHINHERKRHYASSWEAEKVAKRSFEQNPMHSANIHHYKCPVCTHHDIKDEKGTRKHWVVGHNPPKIGGGYKFKSFAGNQGLPPDKRVFVPFEKPKQKPVSSGKCERGQHTGCNGTYDDNGMPGHCACDCGHKHLHQ